MKILRVLSPIMMVPAGISAFTSAIHGMERHQIHRIQSSVRKLTSQLAATDDSFDVETVRRRLESLVGAAAVDSEIKERPRAPTSGGLPSTLLEIQLPPPPPLTAIERERRKAEIQLLEQLSDDDEALSSLWNLWFQERGPKAAAKLLQAEEWSSQGPGYWKQAEALLQQLVEEYGVYWVEPINRLATLYYLQGRLEESEHLCQTVLRVKPWHFGALSGIVMVYAQQHDVEKARLWAAKRLPTLAPFSTTPNRRRQTWIDQAIQDARKALKDAEQRVHDSFGEPDSRDLDWQ